MVESFHVLIKYQPSKKKRKKEKLQIPDSRRSLLFTLIKLNQIMFVLFYNLVNLMCKNGRLNILIDSSIQVFCLLFHCIDDLMFSKKIPQ